MEKDKRAVRDPFKTKREPVESKVSSREIPSPVKMTPPWKLDTGEPIQHTTVTLSPEEHRFLEWVRRQIIKQRTPKGRQKITKSAVVRAVLSAFMDVAPSMDFSDVKDEGDLKIRFVAAVKRNFS